MPDEDPEPDILNDAPLETEDPHAAEEPEDDGIDWDTYIGELTGESGPRPEAGPPEPLPESDGVGLLEEPSKESILELIDRYERSAGADEAILWHLPIFFVMAAAKVATVQNTKEPVYHRSPGVPYRFLLHLVVVGPSGSGKGETWQQFQWIIGSTDSPLGRVEAIWRSRNFQGGRPQGLRGGHRVGGRGEPPELIVGLLEELNDGFVHIPEFTQLANKRKTEDGSVQEIVAGMDTGDYDFTTIAGGRHEYHSDVGIVADLQTAKLDDAEALIVGLNRRTVYENFRPRGPSHFRPGKRAEVTQGDPAVLSQLRAALRRLKSQWKPTSIDWAEIDEWMQQEAEKYELTQVDEQLVRTLALGYHMLSTYEWAGPVRIQLTPYIRTELVDRIRWRHQARSSPEERGSRDTFEVLEDPLVLGTLGRTLPVAKVVQIVARYLSVTEEQARSYLQLLMTANRQGIIWLETEEKPSAVAGASGMITHLQLNQKVLEHWRSLDRTRKTGRLRTPPPPP